MRYPFLQKLREEIFDPEIETILHASPLRLKWLGIFTLLGHPLFWYVWAVLLPQPYENGWVRAGITLTGLGLFLQQTRRGLPGILTRRYFSLIFWLQLPVFFTWMYWLNGGNAVWLASFAAMILIYFQMTDWRLATIGVVTGVATGTTLAYIQLGYIEIIPTQDIVVFGFSLMASLTMAASNANMRRERIRHSLVIIGIMAHELRTPIAAVSLISQAIRTEASNDDHEERIKHLEKMVFKLETLTRMLNHHIDMQMINARFMELPKVTQMVSAESLVRNVIHSYPYGSHREDMCVELIIHDDFWFHGAERQFSQVINNLLKNAFYSLKAAQSRFVEGDLRVEVGTKDGSGKITISDNGIGINADHIHRIFEPFFSTSDDTGHGLGLAYCRQVVQSSGGVLRVKSQPAFGAIFTIDLPVQVHPPLQAHEEPHAH